MDIELCQVLEEAKSGIVSFLEKPFFFLLLPTVTFYISVNLPFRMQILQALQDFPQYCRYVGLFKRAWAELKEQQDIQIMHSHIL